MSIAPTQPSPLQAQSTALDQFNELYGAENDSSRYEMMQFETRATGPVVNLLNYLQISELIPARLTILMKNNLHDRSFVRACLNNLIFDLRDRGVIGPRCFEKLHTQLNAYSIDAVLKMLYSVLLYQKLEEEHRRNSNDPLFQFVSSEVYSERLTRLSSVNLDREIYALESNFQKRALAQMLAQLAAKQGVDEASRERIIALARGLASAPSPRMKQELLTLFNTPPDGLPYFEKLCLQEIGKALQSSPPERIVKHLYEILAVEHHLKQCERSVKVLNDSLETMPQNDLSALIAKCKQAYNGTVYLLSDYKNLPRCSSTRFHLLVGQIREQWICANQVMTRATGQLDHQFCSSLVQQAPTQYRLAAWPFRSNQLIDAFTPEQIAAIQSHARIEGITPADREANSRRTIAVIGCTWGGGHVEVSRSLASNLIGAGYHAETIDLPKVLVSEDPVRNAWLTRFFNLNWTTNDLWNGLAKIKAFSIMNFIRTKHNGAPNPQQHQRMLMQTLHELMKKNPSMVVTTYSAHNEVIFDACEILGIPCLHISTDVDTSVETRSTPRASPHMKMGIAFSDPQMLARIETVTRPEQRVIMGPPVRREFTLARTREDSLRFKQTWGIDSSKKVVVVTSGSNGDASDYPEILAQRYADLDRSEIPIHLVVLCGRNNQKFLDHLERNVAPNTNLPMTLKLAVPGEKMEELITMASEGGCLIGKAGGGTLFEATARGTRILIDHVPSGMFSGGLTQVLISIASWILDLFGYENQLLWEKINTAFGIRHGLADVIETKEEFLPKLDRMLQHDAPAVLPFPIENCRTVFRRTLESMLTASEADPENVRIRQQLLSA